MTARSGKFAAVAPNAEANVGNPFSALRRYPEPGGDGKRMAGTELRHVLRLAESGRNVTAIVCFWTYRSAWQQPTACTASKLPKQGRQPP